MVRMTVVMDKRDEGDDDMRWIMRREGSTSKAELLS